MKIFISGSAKINTLNDTVERILSKTLNSGHEILIGDCNGVDSLIQSYYAQHNYPKVSVYHVGSQPRNFCTGFTAIQVPTENEASAYRYYQRKDIRMTELADVGFVIWDGISKGTCANIDRMLKAHKAVAVHLITTQKTYALYQIEDLNALKTMI